MDPGGGVVVQSFLGFEEASQGGVLPGILFERKALDG